MKITMSAIFATKRAIVPLLVFMMFNIAKAQICAQSSQYMCDPYKAEVCVLKIEGGKPSGSPKTKCENFMDLKLVRPGGWYSKGSKFFEVQNCGACPTPNPTPTPTPAPITTPAPTTPAPTTPFPTTVPSASPSNNPTYFCGPSLPVHALIHFEGEGDDEGGNLAARNMFHGNRDVDSIELDGADECLFGCAFFDIRTNCWVDLKVTRDGSTGEMKFQINNGLDAVKSSVHDDSVYNMYALQGNLRFFDDTTDDNYILPHDVNGEIEFIKIYDGVVEDLTATVEI